MTLSTDALAGDTVTPSGQQLAQVYNESDLLVVECLRSGVWDGLSAPELAACVSVLVYETRGPADTSPKVPGGAVQQALGEMVRQWARLKEAEEAYDIVIVDTPPLSVVSDAIPLVNKVSGVVVVVRLVKNTRNALVALKDQLIHLGAPTLGVVVTTD